MSILAWSGEERSFFFSREWVRWNCSSMVITISFAVANCTSLSQPEASAWVYLTCWKCLLSFYSLPTADHKSHLHCFVSLYPWPPLVLLWCLSQSLASPVPLPIRCCADLDAVETICWLLLQLPSYICCRSYFRLSNFKREEDIT